MNRSMPRQWLLAAAGGVLAVAEGAAQTDAPRFLQPVSPAGIYPQHFATGDFNIDGKPDLAVTHNFDNLVTIMLGEGNGTFTTRGAFVVQSSILFIAVADFDGDGNPDLATANYNGDSVSILLGDGTGSFAAPVTYIVGLSAQPAAIAVADFDGDGELDLAVVRDDTGFGHLTTLFGLGDGTFALGGTLQLGSGPRSVAVGDFDGEGHPDLAIANMGSEILSTVSIVMNNGIGGFAVTGNKAVGKLPFAIAAGDVDGDGHLDLLTANYGSDDVSLLLGTGTAFFANSVSFAAGLGHPEGMVLTDFDEDGDPDIGLVSQFSSSVSILRGGTGSTFASGVLWPVGLTAVGMATADIDGDGHADILTDVHAPSGTIPVLLGNGDGSFSINARSATGDGPRSLATADFNGDRRPDLAVANAEDDTVSVLLSHAGGELVLGSTVAAGNQPDSLAVGDFNGDGQPDLAVATGFGSVTSLLGAGDGSFASAGEFASGVFGASLAVGDLSGDGIPDAAVAGQPGLGILLGVGNGRFKSHATIPLDDVATAVAMSDFDGDGTLDLAAALDSGFTGIPGTVAILLGQGGASFTARGSFPTGPGPSGLVVGDFNDDGIADLATANNDFSSYTGGSVWILLGQGDGGFTSTGLPVPGAPNALAVGDLDGDAKQDLAVGSLVVSVLLGDGDGGFALESSFAAGNLPQALAIADFDGDGRQDIAAAAQYDDTVVLMLNQGPAAWTDVGLALAGEVGDPLLIGEGPLSAASTNRLRVSHAAPLSPGGFFFGLEQAEVPFKGGILVPSPDAFVPRPTDAAGVVELEFGFPPAVPPGLALYFQFWIQDAGAVAGAAGSNGLKGVTP